MTTSLQPTPAQRAAAAVLAEHAGILEYAERAAGIRFIHAASIGVGSVPAGADRLRLVAAVEREVFDADQLVIFAPDADPDPERQSVVARVQLLIHARPLDENDHAIDRFQAYHGDPTPLNLAECSIDSVRVIGHCGGDGAPTDLIVDGDELRRHTLPRGAESPVLRKLNADRERLAAVCARNLGVSITQPTAVGADRLGIDIRARFGILRLRWQTGPQTTPDDRLAVRLIQEDLSAETVVSLVDELLAMSDNPAP